MIRLSIITPYYNMPETLCRLSASIPQEPWIEHIIVNDKSDMDPAALLNAKQYVTARGARGYDNTTQYKGTGICRDIGIRRAAGEWILIADADDFFTDNAFEIIRRHIEDPADLFYFAPTSIKEGTSQKSDRHIPYERVVREFAQAPTRENELRLRYLSVPDTSKLIRREMIRKYKITSSHSAVSNDVMFSTRCAYHADKIAVSGEAVYCITEGAGTLTTTKDVGRFRQRIDMYIRQCRFLKKHLPEDSFSLIGLSASGLLYQCYRDYGQMEVMRSLLRIIRYKAPVNILDLQTRRSGSVSSESRRP